MTGIRYTLLSDGSSDKRLIPILTWLLHEHCPDKAVHDQWADFSKLPKKPKTLEDKIINSIELFPCDILFIHRDAERLSYTERVQEICEAINKVPKAKQIPSAICVVPVRMQEAWIVFNEAAIRRAAGNPRGRNILILPDLNQTETINNPKDILEELLISASGYSSGRRLKTFKRDIPQKAHLVAEFIEDFAPLRNLPAFVSLEADLKRFIMEKGWN